MPPERYVQNCGGTSIKSDETLRRYVKRMIDAASEPTTMYGVARLRPVADEPITTGRSGKMHGARTVRIPAINETARRAIVAIVQ